MLPKSISLTVPDTVEHTYDACPKYSELGSFRIIAYLYVGQRQYSKKKVQRFYI